MKAILNQGSGTQSQILSTRYDVTSTLKERKKERKRVGGSWLVRVTYSELHHS